MDGFAVHYDDLQGQDYVRVERVLGGIEFTLAKGSSIPVATGDLLPEGAAAVIPHERVKVTNDLFIPPRLEPGSNIRQPDEDFIKGEVIVSAGNLIPRVLSPYWLHSGSKIWRSTVRPGWRF